MSTMKICPKCNSEQFKVNLVAEGVVTLAVTEAGVEYQLLSQGDLGIDNSVLVCASCGEGTQEVSLVDGMMSAVSNKYFPITELVQVEVEGGGHQIMTQSEYEAMTAPTIDSMNEDQLRETAKSQQATLEQMQAQMQALMAQMAALQAGGATPTAPAQTTAKKGGSKAATPTAPAAPQAPQAPAQPSVQAPSVPTNIPAPEASGDVNVIDPSSVNVEEVPAGDFFGSEAPF